MCRCCRGSDMEATAVCPVCSSTRGVITPKEIVDGPAHPGEALMCVSCASFITWDVVDDDATFRVMTTEEIADLPDPVRMLLMRCRSKIERATADLKRVTFKCPVCSQSFHWMKCGGPPDRKPKSGDLAQCGECRSPLVLRVRGDTIRARMMTRDELNALPPDIRERFLRELRENVMANLAAALGPQATS